jgi:hypothetical protein
MKPHTFSYSDDRATSGLQANLPFVPTTLSYREQLIQVPALIDSGSSVNVLPYDIGQDLGLVWEAQDFPLEVVGVLQGSLAYGVIWTSSAHPLSLYSLLNRTNYS